MIVAAVASAASFFVITKSGIAGTLMGAAVFSAVYSGASHWIGEGAERCASWWLERRGLDVADTAEREMEEGTLEPAAPTPSEHVGWSARRVRMKRIAATWAPLSLAVLAFAASGYSIATGTPVERIVIRERVVEKPIVEERIVVQRDTVTVTVPVSIPDRSSSGSVAAPPPSTTTTLGASADSTTTTAGSDVTSSTTTVTTPPPPSTTTSTTTG